MPHGSTNVLQSVTSITSSLPNDPEHWKEQLTSTLADLARNLVESPSTFEDFRFPEVFVRVGERISDGIPVEKLDEFEMIVDGDSDFVQSWILSHAADYKNDPIYQAFLVQNGGQESAEITNEFAAMKWLQLNRPDFTQIVAVAMDEMKGELRANIDKIVG